MVVHVVPWVWHCLYKMKVYMAQAFRMHGVYVLWTPLVDSVFEQMPSLQPVLHTSTEEDCEERLAAL